DRNRLLAEREGDGAADEAEQVDGRDAGGGEGAGLQVERRDARNLNLVGGEAELAVAVQVERLRPVERRGRLGDPVLRVVREAERADAEAQVGDAAREGCAL